MNFPPFDSFRDRSTSTYRAENTRIDAIIYRITDRAHTDTLIDNVQRGVGFRLITEPHQYRDESRLWHSWNVDRLYKAGLLNPINGQPGIQVRHRLHAGLTHEKLSIMIGQGISVIGSSNWTSASSDYQLEHNLFTHDPAFYAWSRNHFERKWNNLGGCSRDDRRSCRCLRTRPVLYGTSKRRHRPAAHGHPAVARRTLGAQVRRVPRHEPEQPGQGRERRGARPVRQLDDRSRASLSGNPVLLAASSAGRWRT